MQMYGKKHLSVDLSVWAARKNNIQHNQCSPVHEQIILQGGSLNEVKMNEWPSVNKYKYIHVSKGSHNGQLNVASCPVHYIDTFLLAK